ncbi:MAG TPA: GAF domain-containing protein [Anaerolineales bacterium]
MTNPEKEIFNRATSTLFQYDRWRVTFLVTVLRVVSGLGLVLIVSNIPVFRTIELIAFSIVYVALLVVTFTPLPYNAKAGALIVSGYFVSVYTLLQFGPWSGVSVYFLATTLFAVLLFDDRIDRWVFTINMMTIITVATLNTLGYLTLTSTEIPQTDLLDWLSYTADYFVLAIALIWAISMLKTEFKLVAEQFQSALGFLSKDRADLEKRVEERTAGLIRKTDQLRAASYIARQTTEIQNLNTILNVVAELVTDQFGFYHSGIFLMNEMGSEVVLASASSEGGKRMVEKGHSLKVGSQGIVGNAAAQKKPRIALDVGADAVFFNNPDLPRTRSEVALPLVIHDRVLGVLDIQSDQPQAFNMEEIDVLQTLADQVAVAIENTRLLEESQMALSQIEALTAVRTREAWSQKIQERNFTYTYTPLGIRAGKTSEESDQALNIPITLRGQKIGAIAVERKDGTPWSQIDKDLINEVAYQTGLAVDNVRLVEEATQRAKQEQTVGELASRFSQNMDIDTLLQTAARELGQVADVVEVSVFIGEIPEQSSQKRRSRRTAG